MLIEYQVPSPKAGIKEHQSRETAAALIAAGFAKAVPLTDADRVPDKDDVMPPRPARGWEVAFYQWGDERKPVIVFNDGAFGKTIYEGVPGPTRRWTGEKYEFVPSDCPQSVIAEYFTITGNVEAARSARENAEREERQRALASKNGRVR